MKSNTLTLPIAKNLSGMRPLKVEIPDAAVDYLTPNCERRLTSEEANRETDKHPAIEAQPITGWRRLLIKWRLKCKYWAECKAAVQ
jgi:hypothetical protein